MDDGTIFSTVGILLFIAITFTVLIASRLEVIKWQKKWLKMSSADLVALIMPTSGSTMFETPVQRQELSLACYELKRRGEDLMSYIPKITEKLLSDSKKEVIHAQIMCEAWFPKERNEVQRNKGNAFGVLVDNKSFNAALAESLTRKFEEHINPKVASERNKTEMLKQLASNHKWFRNAILFLICMAIFFVMTSGVIPGSATKDNGFASAALGFGFLFVYLQLWSLAFRLYPKSKAIAVCALSLLTIPLPIVIYFVDRKAVRFLAAQGICTSLIDVFKM